MSSYKQSMTWLELRNARADGLISVAKTCLVGMPSDRKARATASSPAQSVPMRIGLELVWVVGGAWLGMDWPLVETCLVALLWLMPSHLCKVIFLRLACCGGMTTVLACCGMGGLILAEESKVLVGGLLPPVSAQMGGGLSLESRVSGCPASK